MIVAIQLRKSRQLKRSLLNKRITAILAALILVLLAVATYHGLLQFKNTRRITPPNNKNAQGASVATDIPRPGTTPTKPVWAKKIDNPTLVPELRKVDLDRVRNQLELPVKK